MELLVTQCLGKQLRLQGSMAGWQQLYWDNQLVSQKNASSESCTEHHHNFQLNNGTDSIECDLTLTLQWQPFKLNYQLSVNDQVVSEGSRDTKDIEQQTPVNPIEIKQKPSIIGLGAMALKLFKSAKLIKVLLAGASLGAYSWLLSFEFAIALLVCLVIHEYGHIRAMKYFNMKTKGIYLIPFLGGLALSDSKINTRWQDVVISIMGPTFGLFLSIAALIAYWVTDLPFFAALASLNALLNLINLFPILPLDGGHILKSISFSFNSMVGIALCTLAAIVGIYFSFAFHLNLLAIMLIIGSVEIISQWRHRHHTHLLPLDRYGQVFSIIWYFLSVAALLAIIFIVAQNDDPIMRIPLYILNS